MKKFVYLLLALVLILSLAGCKVSSRPYRRYGTYTTDTATTYDNTQRARLRTVNPADAPLYNDSLYRSGTRTVTPGTATPGTTVVPSPSAGVAPNRNNRTFNVPS